MATLTRFAITLAIVISVHSASSQELPPNTPTSLSVETWSRHHVLFIVGLPGDIEHQRQFEVVGGSLQAEFIKRGLPPSNITMLTPMPAKGKANERAANRESIRHTLGELAASLEKEDTFWLIMMGHADHDGEHARFHISGPDLRAIDYADLLKDLACKEQVFWLTMSSSGWFTEPLSTDGRIVITATTRDAEPNATEFPQAFLKALASPGSELDRDGDNSVSVLELFAKTHENVAGGYQANDRVATEHATIDDNADGRGTEWDAISQEFERMKQVAVEVAPVDSVSTGLSARDAKDAKSDGKLANTVQVPYPVLATQSDSTSSEKAESEDFEID